MIQWLENKHPQNPVFPKDPVLGFLALLIEDYGDEWLWRPAMWWRWVPKVSRVSLGRRIVSELISSHLAISTVLAAVIAAYRQGLLALPSSKCSGILAT